MQAELSVRRTLQHDLGDALSRNEFELHYQPMIDMASRRTCGVEALVRWHHPRHGLVSPERFIPLAEEMGKIVALGEWILGEACRQAMRWPPDIKIAVNVSPHQFRSGRLVAAVTRALAESGLSAHRLEIELTESALLRNTAENLESLRQLKSLGVTIVLDDFGTGYSSLTYLRMFSFDKIKIDKTFVLELSTSTDCAAIVCAITGLARSLDMITTAEGVETQEQYDLLRIAGCSQAQGHLFGGPQPAHELKFPHNQYEIRDDAWMQSEVAWAT
jgi:EAL domain-containing protein (putative c-di-GMP-specific phosphodiesterase class I)